MEIKSYNVLKKMLNLENYSASPYYVGFFEYFNSKKFSREEAQQHLILWFLQNIYQYPGTDVFWKVWLLPKLQIVNDSKLSSYLPLIHKMCRSGMVFTLKEYLSEWSKNHKFRHQFNFQKDVSVDVSVDLFMSSNFSNIASRYIFINKNLELIFIYNDDEGGDLVGLTENGRTNGIQLLKSLRQREDKLWRCIISCEGEFIDTKTEYPYQIKKQT